MDGSSVCQGEKFRVEGVEAMPSVEQGIKAVTKTLVICGFL